MKKGIVPSPLEGHSKANIKGEVVCWTLGMPFFLLFLKKKVLVSPYFGVLVGLFAALQVSLGALLPGPPCQRSRARATR